MDILRRPEAGIRKSSQMFTMRYMLGRRRAWLLRCLAGLFAAAGFMCTLEQQSAGAPASPAAHRDVIDRYCVSCHNDSLKAAGLALNTLAAHGVDRNPEVWEKVVRKLRARQMPPVGMPRPAEAGYEAVVLSLETLLDRAAAAKPNPGRTDTFRRLNRTQYQNAIRDLLALDVDVASLLPRDESSYGFDNVTVGDLSPTLLDRYISVAEKISRLAVGAPSRSPGGETIRIPADLTQEEHLEGLPIGTRGGAVVPYTFPLDGEYEFQVRLARDRNEHIEGLSEAHELELLMDRARVQLFTVKPPQHQDGVSEDAQSSHDTIDQHLKIRVAVSAGPHTIGVAFLKSSSAL